MKGYALVGVNWEYNDEYYYEQGHNTPSSVYRSKDAAEEARVKAELAFFNEQDFGYFYMSESPDEEEMSAWFLQNGYEMKPHPKETYGLHSKYFSPPLKAEHLESFKELYNCAPYDIIEVEIHEEK